MDSDVHNEQTDQNEKDLKYTLLGPIITKAGYEGVDKNQISEFLHKSSKGSLFFDHQAKCDRDLAEKTKDLVQKKRQLELTDLSFEFQNADQLIADLEKSRDLSQFIVHIDCDCFHASVEKLDHPELENAPFAVGEVVIAACNYVARSYGCRNGMLSSVALQLCPDLKLLRPNPAKYKAKMDQIRQVMAKYDPRFESSGEDEAYLNITRFCSDNQISTTEAVKRLRLEIRETTGIPVAAGVAANTQLAKICATFAKPDGQFHLPNNKTEIMALMESLPVRKAIGVGRAMERQLAGLEIHTCGEIYSQRHFLRSLFGEFVRGFLIELFLGLGRTELKPQWERSRKSVSLEKTFPETSDTRQIHQRLKELSSALEKVMVEQRCRGRTLSLKMRLRTFETCSRQIRLPKPTSSGEQLYHLAEILLRDFLQNRPGASMRLLGLRCTGLLNDKDSDITRFLTSQRSRTTDDKSDSPQISSDSYTDASIFQSATESTDRGGCIQLGGTAVTSPIKSVPESHDRGTKKDLGNTRNADCDAADLSSGDILCPVCHKVQPNGNVSFNQHLDFCLSRSAIREAISNDDTHA
ncbi:DNA polymerase kappa [Colletotrichum truncatum]|uniref:DNA polymerase kappa n=1 Tax=Colletotrichum truncatum TaxID=5467 RepID=A0ACC3YVJ8_COLTU|nr:DNA polymerase kappa [Colletotrichum truncatum]KAF6798674.1 DNA polymerase kappa [Colletotrichum truncatum]